jgi:hypothetical protein
MFNSDSQTERSYSDGAEMTVKQDIFLPVSAKEKCGTCVSVP